MAFSIISCDSGSDSGTTSGGAGADFDASLYYTKTDLDSGQLDTRYYTETEIDSAFYTSSEVDALVPVTSPQTRFIDGYDSFGSSVSIGWDTRTDDQTGGTLSPYAGWLIPSDARYCLFQVEFNNCQKSNTNDVNLCFSTDGVSASTFYLSNELFPDSTYTLVVYVGAHQGQTMYAYIGGAQDPGLDFTNTIRVTNMVYFK